MGFKFSADSLNLAASRASQDRVWFDVRDHRLRVALADGAGGAAGGARAAEMFVAFFEDTGEQSITVLRRSFTEVDTIIADDSIAGDTTGVFLTASGDEIVGASVGDSEAWFLPQDADLEDLTEYQVRKPLLGSSHSIPTLFRRELEPGILLLASDGLTKYAKFSKVLASGVLGALLTYWPPLENCPGLPHNLH